MGMLNEAKKKAQKSESDKENLHPDPKHKKKHTKPSPEVASNVPGVDPGATEPGSSGPDAEPEGNAEAGGENGASDEGAPDPGVEESAPDAQAQGGTPPGQPQDEEGQSADEGGAQPAQGDAPSADAGQEQGQDAGGQGAPPSGGDDDDTAGGGESQPGGAPQDHVDLSKIPISPALKEEFMRCNAALHTALYTNDKLAQSVIDGVVPEGPHKVESVARMATLLVVQIDKQLHFIKDTPQVVMPFTQDVVEHVLDLVTQVKGLQFSEQEAHAALGTAHEIILHTVGVNKAQVNKMSHLLPRSQIMDGLTKYKAHLQFIKGVQGPNSPDQGAAGAQAAPSGAQPDSSGAQGQPQPQPGAPVTAAPGPGQSAPPGGMLTAAQAPQGGA